MFPEAGPLIEGARPDFSMDRRFRVMQQNNTGADYVRDGPFDGHIRDFGIVSRATQHILGIR
jgi:hypothetical protein